MVRYFYQNEKISESAICHLFKYLSAITGINFVKDSVSPDFFFGAQSTPGSARVMIGGYGNRQLLILDSENPPKWSAISDEDPIENIALKLSLNTRIGPFSEKQDGQPPPTERTLSEAIKIFVNSLSQARLIPLRDKIITLWPDGYNFGFAVTHDVDILRRTVPGSVRLLFNRHRPGGFKGLLDSLFWRLGFRPNPYDDIARWIEIENEAAIKSTYFVFAGIKSHKFDPVYKPEWLSLDALRDQNFGISLHSSVASHSGAKIADARAALERISGARALGIRPHYLSAFFPEYWRAAQNAGFIYSSALGFDDIIGYFGGIDLPFYPFDSALDKSIEILEISIAIMDCGLIGNSSAGSDAVFERGSRLLERAAKCGGLIVLDWHQGTSYNRDYPGWAELFIRLVKRAGECGAYFTTLEDIAALMKDRIGD